MKNKIRSTIFTACFIVTSVYGQGSLTPPGAPAATMKSLVQIEPRTPISSAPFTITNSGSYYLTTNLLGVAGFAGIIISTNDVSIDLNGFSLIGVAGAVEGVNLLGQLNNVSIVNGTIRNWPNRGINSGNDSGSTFARLTLMNNGSDGIWTGASAIVQNCIVVANGVFGIGAGDNSVVENCVARTNGYGIAVNLGGVIRNCSSMANANYGFYAYSGSVVESCSARGNGGTGIFAYDGCNVRACSAIQNGAQGINVYNGFTAGASTVSGCSVSANLGDGIYLNASGCNISDNTSSYNGPNGATNIAGIHIDGSQNRIEGNNLSGNHNRGLLVGSAGNFIIRNSAMQNSVNYDLTGTQTLGPIVTATGVITTNNPWANFSF